MTVAQGLIKCSDSLEVYMSAVARIAVLDRSEEKRLALRYRERQDTEAARSLVLHNLRFVVAVAHGYKGYGLQLSDLIQEGNIGLMKAVKRFDPRRGTRLISFAAQWIKSAICDFIIKNWRIVKIATTKAQRKLFFNLRKMRSDTTSSLTREVIANKLSVSQKDVAEMERRLYSFDKSFEQAENSYDGSSYAPAEYLSDARFDPVLEAESRDDNSMRAKSLERGLRNLDERSQKIVKRRWLADSKATLKELSAELGVSIERVRQIEAKAFSQLKKHILAAWSPLASGAGAGLNRSAFNTFQ